MKSLPQSLHMPLILTGRKADFKRERGFCAKVTHVYNARLVSADATSARAGFDRPKRHGRCSRCDHYARMRSRAWPPGSLPGKAPPWYPESKMAIQGCHSRLPKAFETLWQCWNDDIVCIRMIKSAHKIRT